MCNSTNVFKKTMEPCSFKPQWFSCLDNTFNKINIMAQNKLKLKVEALTNVVQQLIKEVQTNASLAQGVLTAFQLHIGKEEWDKIVDELKKVEERKHAAAAGINEKKLEL